jgi:signal peptide peptidase SppA
MDAPDWMRRMMPGLGEPKPLVSVVRLAGPIGVGGPFGRSLTLQGLAGTLARAFAPKRQAAVALIVNSPGGSPVQSSLIGARIRALADEKKVPVIAFCEDVAASGGYWLACAADEVFADESSIVGSIGVISAGFGLHGLIGRYGVERRVYTAGSRKGVLDPFRPEDPEDVALLRSIQGDVHDAFKRWVRERRGDRLKGEEEELFSGAFWSGRGALERGLVDGIGHARQVLRERFGKDVRLRAVSAERGWRSWRRTPFSAVPERIAGGLAAGVAAAAEERALWARYGL